MGVEYALVHDESKTCFELGKGSWYYDLFPIAINVGEDKYCTKFHVLQDCDVDLLVARLIQYSLKDNIEQHRQELVDEIVSNDLILAGKINLYRQIVEFCRGKTVELINDCGDDMRDSYYHMLGSRYDNWECTCIKCDPDHWLYNTPEEPNTDGLELSSQEPPSRGKRGIAAGKLTGQYTVATGIDITVPS